MKNGGSLLWCAVVQKWRKTSRTNLVAAVVGSASLLVLGACLFTFLERLFANAGFKCRFWSAKHGLSSGMLGANCGQRCLTLSRVVALAALSLGDLWTASVTFLTQVWCVGCASFCLLTWNACREPRGCTVCAIDGFFPGQNDFNSACAACFYDVSGNSALSSV